MVNPETNNQQSMRQREIKITDDTKKAPKIAKPTFQKQSNVQKAALDSSKAKAQVKGTTGQK